MQTGLARQ